MGMLDWETGWGSRVIGVRLGGMLVQVKGNLWSALSILTARDGLGHS